jgi:Bacterial Ig domain
MRSHLSRFLLMAFCLTCIPSFSDAQLTFTSPPLQGTKISACNDYASEVLNNPWDMNDAIDINNYMPSSDLVGFKNPSFSGGMFSGVADTNDPFFHLLSPPLCSAQPASGRWGSEFPIDSSRFNTLSLRMFTDTASFIQIVWNTGCDYYPDFAVSDPIPTKPGWNVYTIDLNTIGLSSASGRRQKWNQGPVTGLRIDPTAIKGATVIIDWISLYGTEGCGTTAGEGSASAAGSESRYSAFLDDDGDPFNGFIQQLSKGGEASGLLSLSVSARGLTSGDYKVNGFVSSDYALLTRVNAWDMNEERDVLTTAQIGSKVYSGGTLTGTTSTDGGLIFLDVPSPGIPASDFSKLSFRLTRSSSISFSVIWTNETGSHQVVINPLSNPPLGDGVYQIDLASNPSWTGTVTALAINPAFSSGVSFGLDFVSLRNQGYVTSLAQPTPTSSPGVFTVNKMPLMTIFQPDAKGGEGFAPGNMRTQGDITFSENVDIARILPFHSIQGLVGDFFHGRNILNNDDPINWSYFHTTNPGRINADLFRNLTFKLFVDPPFDLVLGSVARANWSQDAVLYGTTQDIVIFDGWHEYTVDLATSLLETQEAPLPWRGVIDNFRVDSHEFMAQRNYYFDYIQLRADDRANQEFPIVFSATDPDGDTDSLSVTLQYSTNSNGSNPVSIATFPYGGNEKGIYRWNTSSLPEGTYYVSALLSDGLNTTRRKATGRLVITRQFSDTSAPQLSLESPVEGDTFDTQLQVKGFALDAIQVADVRVFIDGVFYGRTSPSLFHLGARDANPSLVDSSNAGFNTFIPTTGVGAGTHLIRVDAIDTAGNTTSREISVTKSPGAVPTVREDPSPTGDPISVGITDGEVKAPVLARPRRAKNGKLTFKVTSISRGCDISIFAGSKPANVTDLIRKYRIEIADEPKGITFQAGGLRGVSGVLYLKASSDCGRSGKKDSKVVTLRLDRKGKAYPDTLRRLRRSLAKR